MVELDGFLPGFQTKEFKKGEMLLRPGEKSKTAFLVVKGCLKSYFTDDAGKEYIMQFAPEGWAISDMNSIVNNVPGTIFIDAIEDTEVRLMNLPFLPADSEMPNMVPVDFVNKLVNSIIAANKRMALLLSSTAEERYINFIDTYPALANRISLKLIASYIGITPEYLSEIRNKMAKKQIHFVS